jgi:AcrR family transcriptional regulator
MSTNDHIAGRPRSHEVDAAITRAAVELLATRGPDGLTINAVARRSGVARASIYLRYPGREALLAAALRAAIGREPIAPSGDLETDIRAAGAQVHAILATPSLRAVLPEIIRGLLRQAQGDDSITFDLIAPARRTFHAEYGRLAASSGLRIDVDPDLVLCMILGSMMMLLFANGIPPTREMANQTVEIILDGLKGPIATPA